MGWTPSCGRTASTEPDDDRAAHMERPVEQQRMPVAIGRPPLDGRHERPRLIAGVDHRRRGAGRGEQADRHHGQAGGHQRRPRVRYHGRHSMNIHEYVGEAIALFVAAIAYFSLRRQAQADRLSRAHDDGRNEKWRESVDEQLASRKKDVGDLRDEMRDGLTSIQMELRVVGGKLDTLNGELHGAGVLKRRGAG